jgi:predicted TIM-barrel fold metal-dependent hydrolase
MKTLTARPDSWLEQHLEPVIDPDRRIIDPHHHLWRKRFGQDYLLPELWKDTGSGHCIEQTVFIECRSFYDKTATPERRSLGETAAIAQLVETSQRSGKTPIGGMVVNVDLRLGSDCSLLQDLLAEHMAIAGNWLKGIRFAGAHDTHPEELVIPLQADPDLYRQPGFQQGVKLLGKLGLTYDTWHYHHQMKDFISLAQAVPDTPLILDHFGTPLGTGSYRSQRQAIFEQWQKDISALAEYENVYLKLGGLAMPDNGFGWHEQAAPADAAQLIREQSAYYLHAIECFGPQRCMFESNFPVDRLSISYRSLWNAYKQLVADFSEAEKHALFYGTAARVYQLSPHR